jgi:hypothetical protein
LKLALVLKLSIIFQNSSQEAMRRIHEITNVAVPLHIFDLKDKNKPQAIFNTSRLDAVIHFAGNHLHNVAGKPRVLLKKPVPIHGAGSRKIQTATNCIYFWWPNA